MFEWLTNCFGGDRETRMTGAINEMNQVCKRILPCLLVMFIGINFASPETVVEDFHEANMIL